MDNLYLIGIDLAKNIFHLHGVDNEGREVFKKKLRRDKLLSFVASLPKVKIATESCGGSNYFHHKFTSFGHEAMQIPAQFVKPYVKSNKNDEIDAAAICKAAFDPDMRFVSPREPWQQDIMNVHRIRSRLVKQRTALSNEIRGFLLEYGISCAVGLSYLKLKLRDILISNTHSLSSDFNKQVFAKLYKELLSLEEEVASYDVMIKTIYDSNPLCQKLTKIPGIGIITATALVGEIGNGSNFKNGRELSSYIGLVPRQHSSGGKQRLLGISKRGNRYLRTLLIHGARSILSTTKRREQKAHKSESEFSKNIRLSNWFRELRLRKEDNVAVVALANKLGRICWAVLNKEESYNSNRK